ncbi:MAG: PKD domain-containing protein [Bacteroidota bacterium]|nr:PKD domain-containing protein [Bacteroidota bacterium]
MTCYLYPAKNQRLSLLLFTCLFSLFGHSAFGQLSGTYTIDPSATATKSNYKTISSAVSDMVSGSRSDGGTANGPNVSAKVTFSLSNGNYNERISIGRISGASATNTITFESKALDSTKVRWFDSTSNSTSNDYVVEFNNARFVTLKHLTIARPGNLTYSKVVVFTGNSSFNSLISCNVRTKWEAGTTTIGFTTNYNSAIAFNSSDSSNTLKYCRISRGYNNVYMSGSGANNVITNCILDSAGSSAMYLLSQTNLVINENTVNLGAFASNSGHYVSYGARIETSPNLKMTKNKFYSLSNATVSRCIVLFNCTSTSTTHGIIANNWCWVSGGTTSCTGIALGGNSYLDIYYNNIIITSGASGSAAFYVYPPAQSAGTNNEIVNNNFINKGGGYAALIPGNIGGINVMNYNNLYVTGTNIGNWNGSDYTTFSGWKSGSSQDANSVSDDPGYISNIDLHTTSTNINDNGIYFGSILDDIDGTTRSTTKPDIGADEFTPVTRDAGITLLDSPSYFCANTHNVKVRFTNFGANSITELTINWKINGVTQTSFLWQGTLASGATSSSVTLGKYAFSNNVNYILEVFGTGVNKLTDQNNKNDTLKRLLQSGMTGNYTAGGTTPDFPQINDAVIALTKRGLCGPVTIKIRTGIYPETIVIPQFIGATATNTITFTAESGDSSKTIIDYATASANGVNNSAIQFNGADFVRLHKLTVRRTGANTYASLIEIKNSSHRNEISNCRLLGVKLNATNVNGDIIFSSSDNDTGNVITNNLMIGGNYAVNLYGIKETDNIITKNFIDSTYSGGVRLSGSFRAVVSNNVFDHIGFSITNATNLNIISASEGFTVNANRFLLYGTGAYGINISSSFGTSNTNKPCLISNNMVSHFTTTSSSTPYNISIASSQYVNLIHNSSLVASPSNTGYPIYLGSGNTNMWVANNVWSNEGTGPIIFLTAASQLSACNNNNYFTNGSVFGTAVTTSISSLSGWKTATSLDGNSQFIRPAFTSNTNLYSANPSLNAKGASGYGVTLDFFGVKRNTSKPDLGANEFNAPKNEASIQTIISPSGKICADSITVKVLLKNGGEDTLKTVNIELTVGSTAYTSRKWTGKLKPDDTVTVTLAKGRFVFGNTDIISSTNAPNGQTDGFGANDTAMSVVDVYQIPSAVVGPKTTICSGTVIELGTIFSTTGNSYRWTSRPAGFTSSQSVINVSPTKTTTYILREFTQNGCTKIDSAVITVVPSPVAKTNQKSGTFCSGIGYKLGDSTVAGNTYAWRSKPVGFTSSKNSIYVVPTSTITYYYTETNTASKCIKTDSVVFTIIKGANASTGGNKNICAGASLQLGGTSVVGNTYSWTSRPAGYTSTTSNPTVTPTQSITYILTERVTTSGCVKVDSARITVNPQPKAIITGDKTVCTNTLRTYRSSKVANQTYKWYVVGGQVIGGSDNDTVQVIWVNQTGSSLSLVQSGIGGCKDSLINPITVNKGTTSKFSIKPVCADNFITITDSSLNASSITYKYGDGTSGNGLNKKYSKAGNYTVTQIVSSIQGCVDSTKRTLTVFNQAKASFTFSNSCQFYPINFGNTSSGALNYFWEFGDGAKATNALPTHIYVNPGIYRVKLSAVSPGSCADTTSLLVTIKPSPSSKFKITINGDKSCTFEALDKSSPQYEWVFGDGSTANTSTATHKYDLNKKYIVRLGVTGANGCYTSTDSNFDYRTNSIRNSKTSTTKVNLYPNPISNQVQLSLSAPLTMGADLYITDAIGHRWFAGYMTAGSSTYTISNMENMPDGVYIVTVTGNINASLRMIKSLK